MTTRISTPGEAATAIAASLESVARQLGYLGNGNAASQMGAIEHLAMQVREGCGDIASALREVAQAIEEGGR